MKSIPSPVDRVARIQQHFELSDLNPEVATLLTEISALSDLPIQPRPIQKLVSKFTASWNEQIAQAIAECYLPQASLTVNSAPPVIGRQDIAALEQGFMDAFPDLVFLMDDSFTFRNKTVNCWSFIGTNNGPGGNGNKVNFTGFEVWEIGAENLIAESHEHFDLPTYRSQLNLQD